jgi:E3 ubiquitin-protein ligase MARCH5
LFVHWSFFFWPEDDTEAGWVQPCMCKGTTKWVHQYCLQRWIDEKQKGNSTAKVACPQCNMEYIIIFPKVGKRLNYNQTNCYQFL